ncbi:MAG: hypothetical protein QW265_03810 [Candidatus Bathyarchaeia archaeon]
MKKFKYRKSMEPFKKWLVPTIYEDVPTFLGIPLALRKERGAGIALALGLSILVSVLYLVTFSFSCFNSSIEKL